MTGTREESIAYGRGFHIFTHRLFICLVQSLRTPYTNNNDLITSLFYTIFMNDKLTESDSDVAMAAQEVRKKRDLIDKFLGVRAGRVVHDWNWLVAACKKFDTLNRKKWSPNVERAYMQLNDQLDHAIALYDFGKTEDTLYRCVKWYNTFGKRTGEFTISEVKMNGEHFKIGDAVIHVDGGESLVISKFIYVSKRVPVTLAERIWFQYAGGDSVRDLANFRKA